MCAIWCRNLTIMGDAASLRTSGEAKRLKGDYKGALADLDRADAIQPNDAFTLQ